MDAQALISRVDKIRNTFWGCSLLDVKSEHACGVTRVLGEPAHWLSKAHQKNSKIFYDRHRDLINSPNHNEDRVLK